MSKREDVNKDLDQDIASVEQRKVEAINAILPTLDLPKEEDPSIELNKMRADDLREVRKKQRVGQKNVQAQDGKSQTDKEVEAEIEAGEIEEDEEVDPETGEAIKKEAEEEDELIPKSKVDKRFKSLTAKIKALEAREVRANQNPATNANLDQDRIKLEAMSQVELKQTLRDTRNKSRQLSRSDNDADLDKIGDYDELEDKIHDAMSSYPQRFYNSQVAEINETLEGISYDEDIEDPDNAIIEIKKLAEGIYQKYPKMQTLRTGMKQAYELAIDHYKILQDNNIGKTEQKRVKRENVRLKRKTVLDSSKIKGKSNRQSRKLELLRKKLSSGTLGGATDDDRADFVKENPYFNVENYIPEEYKEKI